MARGIVIQFRLQEDDPEQAEILAYLKEMEERGFSRSHLIRRLLMVGLIAIKETGEKEK